MKKTKSKGFKLSPKLKKEAKRRAANYMMLKDVRREEIPDSSFDAAIIGTAVAVETMHSNNDDTYG